MLKVFTNLNSKSQEYYDKLYKTLPKNIQDYANKKVDATDRNFTIFEYHFIQKHLHCNLEQIKYNKKGKPYFENCKHFSISHSGQVLAIAISKHNVGLDVQTLIPFEIKLAMQVCNNEEFNKIKSSKNPSRQLTTLWVKKESLIKLNGEGFNQDLNNMLVNCKAKFKHKHYKTFELCLCCNP